MGQCILAGRSMAAGGGNELPLISDITVTNMEAEQYFELPKPVLHYSSIVIVTNLTTANPGYSPYFSLCSTTPNNGVCRVPATGAHLCRFDFCRIGDTVIGLRLDFDGASGALPTPSRYVLTSVNTDMESRKMTLYDTRGSGVVNGTIKIYAK